MAKGKSDPCWKGYEAIGTKRKNGRQVPNCVPKRQQAREKAQARKRG